MEWVLDDNKKLLLVFLGMIGCFDAVGECPYTLEIHA